MPAFVFDQTQRFLSSLYGFVAASNSSPHVPPIHTDIVYRAVGAEIGEAGERRLQGIWCTPRVLISPEAIANSRCFTLPSPDTFPAIATLYGGSVNTI